MAALDTERFDEGQDEEGKPAGDEGSGDDCGRTGCLSFPLLFQASSWLSTPESWGSSGPSGAW